MAYNIVSKLYRKQNRFISFNICAFICKYSMTQCSAYLAEPKLADVAL